MKLKPTLIWVFLLGFLVFLSFNKHSKSPLFSYQSVIHADKAGYYIYLPAFFIAGMNVEKLPNSIDKKTGQGFQIDFEQKIVKTKYTTGVAIMELPFFLVAHGASYALGKETSGFTAFYYGVINIASVSYLIIGLLLLYHSLQTMFSKKITIYSLAFILLGSNLYYYAVDETGMSHVYSFALFSALFYLLVFHEKYVGRSIKYGVMIGFVMGMIVLVRPTNILFVFILGLTYFRQLKEIGFIRNWRFLCSATIIGVFVFIPQLLYWKWAYGNYFSYSYGNESFSNWDSPKILETLFAPNNGLFTHSLVMIFVIIGLGIMLYKNQFLSKTIFILFILVTYLTASWWVYTFGCGFGARTFVEYFAILVIPLGVLITKIDSSRLKYFLYPLFLLLIIVNVNMSYHYDECWFGNGNWDWETYCANFF